MYSSQKIISSEKLSNDVANVDNVATLNLDDAESQTSARC